MKGFAHIKGTLKGMPISNPGKNVRFPKQNRKNLTNWFSIQNESLFYQLKGFAYIWFCLKGQNQSQVKISGF